MVNINVFSKTTYNSAPKSCFEEVQRVRQIWMWALLTVAFACLLWMGAHQVVFKNTFGENWLTFSSIGFVAIILGLAALIIYKAQLEVRIDEQGIYHRFFPLQLKFKTIRWEEVEEVYIREYDALSEYGGWGIRYGNKGKAYTVKGRHGLQLVLTDERRLLIGTQRPIELERLMMQLLYDYEVL